MDIQAACVKMKGSNRLAARDSQYRSTLDQSTKTIKVKKIATMPHILKQQSTCG